MGTKIKTKKAQLIRGVVALQKLTNTTRFKYRYQGKEYFLTIPSKSNLHPLTQEQIRRAIEVDVHLQEHDNTQEKYKQLLQQQEFTSDYKQKTPIRYLQIKACSLDIELREFMENTGRTDCKDLYHYTFKMVANWIKQRKKVEWKELPKLLEEMNYAAKTYNNRKFVLALFCKWLLMQNKIDFNPFEHVASKKRLGGKDPRRRRLSDNEVNLILQAIRNDTYLKANNRGYTHSHYYPIFLFLAYTGVRPAEAIGLQVKKVDLNRSVITINEAFARTRKGTSYSCRRMKSTKTGEERQISFVNNKELSSIMTKQCKNKMPNDFVFDSPNGVSCDDRKLNDNVLKPVLKGLGIPVRILYVFRHSFASRCFEQGMDIKTVQALTGHRDINVLLNVYAETSRSQAAVPLLQL